MGSGRKLPLCILVLVVCSGAFTSESESLQSVDDDCEGGNCTTTAEPVDTTTHRSNCNNDNTICYISTTEPIVIDTTVVHDDGGGGSYPGNNENNSSGSILPAIIMVGVSIAILMGCTAISRNRNRSRAAQNPPIQPATPQVQVQGQGVYALHTIQSNVQQTAPNREAQDRHALRSIGLIIPSNMSATNVLNPPPAYSTITVEKSELDFEMDELPPPYNPATMDLT